MMIMMMMMVMMMVFHSVSRLQTKMFPTRSFFLDNKLGLKVTYLRNFNESNEGALFNFDSIVILIIQGKDEVKKVAFTEIIWWMLFK